jgi:hypothetical protein
MPIQYSHFEQTTNGNSTACYSPVGMLKYTKWLLCLQLPSYPTTKREHMVRFSTDLHAAQSSYDEREYFVFCITGEIRMGIFVCRFVASRIQILCGTILPYKV